MARKLTQTQEEGLEAKRKQQGLDSLAALKDNLRKRQSDAEKFAARLKMTQEDIKSYEDELKKAGENL